MAPRLDRHPHLLEDLPEEPDTVSFAAQWLPAYQDDDVRREGFEIEVLQENQDSFAYEIDIRVTNNNDRMARFVSIATFFYNADGGLVGYDFSGIDELEAGSSDFHKISFPLEYFAEPEFDHYEIMIESYLPPP